MRSFVQGNTYVVNEGLFISKVYNGNIQAYKERESDLSWMSDIMGVKFIASNEDNGKTRKRIKGRSGATWTISRAWCRDVTNNVRG